MRLYALAVAVCLLLVLAVWMLMRTRRLREKYAAVWIALTLAVVLVGVFPRISYWLADLVGVQTPANLLFATAIVVLLGVCIQLSTEVSSLEEETRTLAEEVALLRLDVERLTPPAGDDAAGDQP